MRAGDPGSDHERRAPRAVGTCPSTPVDGIDDDGVLVGRTHREAPEIDGVVRLAGDPLGPEMFARPGAIVRATVSGVIGPDLEAKPDLDARIGS